MDLHLVSVPYRYDEYKSGLGAGPTALVAAGLTDVVNASGLTLTSTGEATLRDKDREAGRTAVNIGRLGASTAALVAEAARAQAKALVLTGDDTASIGVVAGLQEAHGAGARIGVVWVDAHGDFNTPDTSYSGILAGMSLAIIAGLAGPNWRAAAGLASPISTDRIVVAGVRELDEKEDALMSATDVKRVTTADLKGDPTVLAQALATLKQRADVIALHLDVDVLDPHHVPSSSTPTPDGLDVPQLASVLSGIMAAGGVETFTVCGVNPGGGARGAKSIASVRRLLELTLPAWNC